ncbi:MAG: STAS domain-containing protein [Acidobacteriaceae bacterium]|jgi:anti-anti-sigma factor
MQTATRVTERTATAASGNTVTILAFGGDISSASKDTVLGAYHGLNGSISRILLDFTGVDYINSSGIAIIIQMLLEAGKAGTQTIGIFGLTPHFQKVFTMVGINKYAALHKDEVAALAAA